MQDFDYEEERFKRNLFFIFVTVFIIYFLASSFHLPGLFFAGNQGTGAATGIVFFTLIESESCNISMAKGWNLISVCAIPGNNSITTLFDQTNSSIRFVLEWNETAQNFLVFSPLQPDPPFDTINPNKSYFVFLDTANATEDVPGTLFEDLNVSMIQDYNTPVYPYAFESAVADYFDSIEGQFSFSLKWNESAQKFLVFSPLSTNPEYNTTTEGEGQFVLVTDAGGATIEYNKSKLES